MKLGTAICAEEKGAHQPAGDEPFIIPALSRSAIVHMLWMEWAPIRIQRFRARDQIPIVLQGQKRHHAYGD